MQHALRQGEGFTLVTGPAGSGKTTLANDVLAQAQGGRVQFIASPGARLGPRDMRHLVATSLGVCCKPSHRSAVLVGIRRALIERQRKWQRVVLLEDDAHELSRPALDELRLLCDMQDSGRLMLQVFLLGQEPLLELIRAPDMEHIRQRIIAAAHLEALPLGETADYISHRLDRAGRSHGPALTSRAVAAIHAFSAGIPRRVNLVCGRLLVLGAVEAKRMLDRDDVETVVKALQQEMRFGAPEPVPQPATRDGSDEPRSLRDHQAAEQLTGSSPVDLASERLDRAASRALCQDEARDGSGPEVRPPDWCEAVESSMRWHEQSFSAAVDPELTTFGFDADAEQPGMPAKNTSQAALKDLSGATGRPIHLLSSSRTKIGRRTEAENTSGPGINVGCVWVSRNHAIIERRGSSYWISDLGSVNGTYVNNERISGQRRLGNGDTVRIARYEFEFASACHLLRSA
jgi:type II secretory pathway predicted ATPase ExeA